MAGPDEPARWRIAVETGLRGVHPRAVVVCRRCGQIWAPLNDPRTCSCGERTERVPVMVAMELNQARQQKIRAGFGIEPRARPLPRSAFRNGVLIARSADASRR